MSIYNKMKDYACGSLGNCQVNSVPNQRKVSLSFQAMSNEVTKERLLKDFANLIEQLKIDFPQQRLICITSIHKDVLYQLLIAAGFKRETHFATQSESIEWFYPEFEEGTYGLNGCGG